MEHQQGGKHQRLHFSRNGSSRFLTVPRTPSDWRASQNALRDFRKTMVELGAPRLATAPVNKGRSSKKVFVATLAMNEKLVTLHIPAISKLHSRFCKRGKGTGPWQFELRSSVDLTAPPLLVVRKVERPEGKKFTQGMVSGFNINGAWRVTMARSVFPALSNRIDILPTTGLTVYEDNGDELVFKLPPGTIPTGFTKHEAPLPSKALVPVPEEETPAPAPAVAPAVAPAPAQSVALTNDQPIQLQLPKQGVSIEAAIAVLNKAKQRLGNNLRFTIEEGGFLSAVHRIGK